MRIIYLCLALLSLGLPASGTSALQPGPVSYRVDWLRAPFDGPMWLVQCTGPCPGDGLALVADPGRFPAGSLRVLGGPYSHGMDLMLDRDRLLAAGLPARALRVDVRDQLGRPIDGILLAGPAELGRLAASLNGPPAKYASPPGAAPGPPSTLCRFRYGPQAGRTVDFAGRPGISELKVGRHCAEADGSLGVVVESAGSPQ